MELTPEIIAEKHAKKLNEIANDLNVISWDLEKIEDYELNEIFKKTSSFVWILRDLINLRRNNEKEHGKSLRLVTLRRAKDIYLDAKLFRKNGLFLHAEVKN